MEALTTIDPWCTVACKRTVGDTRFPPVEWLVSGDNRFVTTTTMFKTAATKLAHNHMIPSLAGNPRLQPLQEVIAAEKLVLQSYVHSSAQTALIPTPHFQSPETQHGI